MVLVFAEKDRSGRIIHLSRERWSHIQKHRGISGALEQIKETLKFPDAITVLSYDPKVRFITNIIKKEENIYSYQ